MTDRTSPPCEAGCVWDRLRPGQRDLIQVMVSLEHFRSLRRLSHGQMLRLEHAEREYAALLARVIAELQ
jgi:hypothetical protein